MSAGAGVDRALGAMQHAVGSGKRRLPESSCEDAGTKRLGDRRAELLPAWSAEEAAIGRRLVAMWDEAERAEPSAVNSPADCPASDLE